MYNCIIARFKIQVKNVKYYFGTLFAVNCILILIFYHGGKFSY